ncbi:MAG: site-2 protease family protein [Candidatus Aenigmarchaeota archaeon]|nr:site-2 protease family protein [Candidatus Aenigmarchaeota archaeon]
MQLREIRDIVVASAVLAFVFSFSYSGPDLGRLLAFLPVAVFAVVVGFVLHELAHRYVARRYGAHAEFRAWREGLLLAIALALATNGGFVFAAPGAVMIYPRANLWGQPADLSRRRLGVIGISGPVVNMVLAAAFYAASLFYPSMIFSFGARVNIWLALFNMIPLPPLDGSKVFAWDRRIWLASFAAIIAAFIFLPRLF